MKTVAIVNPIAGRRRAARDWPHLLRALGSRAAHVTTWWTEGPGHAEVLAASARREGFERVVVVGGDGTLFEVVNGLWWEPEGDLPGLGMVPQGTGCDYVRNFDVGDSLADNLDVALGERVVRVDVGTCRLQDMQGGSVRKAFVNVLGLGYDGTVVKRLRERPMRRLHSAAYALAALRELTEVKSYRLTGRIDGEAFDTDAFILAAGLGRHFGGGMMIAPGAVPDAGRFQVVWGESSRRLEVLRVLWRVYAGRHLEHPRVHARYASRLELAADPPAYVEAEGELLGRTPVEIEICPAALRVAGRISR